jgi:hypothetical protein
VERFRLPAAGFRDGLRSKKVDRFSVTPKAIEIVIGTGFLGKNVDQVVAIIRQNPFGIFEAFHADGVFSDIVKLAPDLFSDGLNLLWIATGGDDEEIGEGRDFAQI